MSATTHPVPKTLLVICLALVLALTACHAERPEDQEALADGLAAQGGDEVAVADEPTETEADPAQESDTTADEPVEAGQIDDVTPTLTPVSDLPDAPPEELHVAYAPQVPPTIIREGQAVIDVHLEVLEGVCTLDPDNGVDTLMWGYRVAGDEEIRCGSPGPVLRGRVGDVARVTLTNLSDNEMGHNIDFHAVTGQGGGAADLVVAPGDTATIEARLLYPGAFMYHCAFGDVPAHIARGMYGMFIVDPEEPLPHSDHEWAVMQSEWYVGEPDGDGIAQFDRQAVTDENPSYVTFNGSTDALIGDNALTMAVGERARIYMVNEGLSLDSNFHPIGSHWDVVYPEAATLPVNDPIRGSQSTLVVAGGGTVVELLGQVPSTILLVDHALPRTFDKGALGQVVVTGAENPEIFSTPDAAASGAGDEEDSVPTELAADVELVVMPEGAYEPGNANIAYQPLDLEVSVGQRVTWVNDDIVFHTVTSGTSDGVQGDHDGGFDSGEIGPGETWSLTFTEPGTYPYFCSPHPWMRGTVTVVG